MTRLIEVYRNGVNSWDCDMMGHLNVQFYVAKAIEGLYVFGQHLGLGPAFVRERDVGLRVCEHHIRFLREQHPGAAVRIVAGVLDATPERMRIYEEMQATGSGEIAATFVSDVVLANRHTGQRLPLPNTAFASTTDLRTDVPEYAAPRGLDMAAPRPAPTLADAAARGMAETYLGEVSSRMCDAYGRMTTAAYMGVVSDGIPNLLAEVGQVDRTRHGIGGAALEYRFVYRATPRVGDILALRSGIRSIGAKTYILCHWMFDLTSGQTVATAEQVAIMLDLKARKAIAITQELRAALQRVVVPDVGV